MWNLLEKGKALAESIDKQLNESVGVDGQPIADTDNNQEEDAWNDDLDAFDDDEFLVDNSGAKKLSEPPTVPPIIPEETILQQEDTNYDDDTDESLLVDPNSPAMTPAPKASAVDSIMSPLAFTVPSRVETAAQEQEEILQEEKPPSPAPIPDPAIGVDDDVMEEVKIPQHGHDQPTIENEEENILVEDTVVAEVEADNEDEEDCVKVTEPVAEEPPQEGEADQNDSLPIVVEKQDSAWEDDMYDDDDEEEEDEEEEEAPVPMTPQTDFQTPVKTDESPPTTITIPTPAEAVVERGVDSGTAAVAAAATTGISSQEMEMLQMEHQQALAKLQSQLEQAQKQLNQRETQIAQKAQQMASMQSMHETEKDELRSKINETKEEAKKRIQKARERVEAMENSVKSAGGKAAEDSIEKDKTINALREEGQKLAVKQSSMEKAVRAAKGETRELTDLLEAETGKKDKALEKIAMLEADLKKTKADLASARKGETLATKLENELSALKEESDKKDANIMSLNQQAKELKAERKELRQQMEAAQKGLLLDSKRESSKLRKEHGDMVTDLEEKLRVTEEKAGVREDALRKEVDELRKRWQDSVRRADVLSMDVQNSTAPLLRQLESLERQGRSRAANWAELESKLRTDLEETLIENDKLVKERNELKSNYNRVSRQSKERDEDLASNKNLVEDQKVKLEKLEQQIEEMEAEGSKLKEEYTEVQRQANEGVSKVRSDMMTTVLESEERHQAAVKSLENELNLERKKRTLLERQVEEMLENAGMMVVPTPSTAAVVPKSVQKKLRSAESQGSILAGAIGFDDEATDDDDEEVEDDDLINEAPQPQNVMSSFAAMEQLSQRLKESKVELEALRRSLASSERVRESVISELSEARIAKEKLPLFEAKVQELARDNQEKSLEIMGLRDDITEIRQLYRGQLNSLLEEKAANLSETSERSRIDMGKPVEKAASPSVVETSSLVDDTTASNGDDIKSNGTVTAATPAIPIKHSPHGAPFEPSKKD